MSISRCVASCCRLSVSASAMARCASAVACAATASFTRASISHSSLPVLADRSRSTSTTMAIAAAARRPMRTRVITVKCGYLRAMKGTWEERFWARVVKGNGCWVWTGAKHELGYGRIHVDGKVRGAHILSFQMHKGPVPAGIFVCHTCDTPSCVNPDHLFLGTPKDNTHDARAKGRLGAPQKSACPRGHSYDGSNVYVRSSYKQDRPPYRDCRTCRNARSLYNNRKRRGEPVPEKWTDLLV